MMEIKNNRITNPTSRREPGKSTFVLKDLALKYYDTLEPIIDDLAQKCTGGEEATLAFPNGRITIKLK